MKEKRKFLTRLKKDFMAIMLLLACLPAFANDPLSISISGPDKIFTNDEVTFNASVVGANANACVWTVTGGGSGSPPPGASYDYKAPGSESTVTISCSVSVGSDNNQRTVEDSMTVTVVEPQITITRKSYTANSLAGNSPLVLETLTDATSTALIHRNLTRYKYQALPFLIEVGPADVKVQKFSITSPDGHVLVLDCTKPDPDAAYTESFSNLPMSSVLSQLPPFRAWGLYCSGANSTCCLDLSINNNKKASWSYKIYGIDGDDIITYRDPPGCAEGLRENEWAEVKMSWNPLYNSLSYAVDPAASYNNKPFLVYTVAPSDWNLSTTPISAAFHSLEEGNTIYGYVTSMDTFGDNNGVLSSQDVDSFFMHNYWGVNKATAKNASMDQCKILYYSGHRAARKSHREFGIYQGWNLFEMKNDAEEIIICRPQQATGGYFKFSKVIEKYR